MSFDDTVSAKNARDRRIAAHLDQLKESYDLERHWFKRFFILLKINWWMRALMP